LGGAPGGKFCETERSVKKFGLYIDGQSGPAASNKWFETSYPYTGEPWALVAEGDSRDVDRAVEAAHRAFSSGPWPKLQASQRAALLRKLADLIDDNAETLALAEMQDNGKAITEVRAQMKTLAPMYHYYAGLADKVHGDVIPADQDSFLNFTTYEPLGVIACITPWNSPLRLLSLKLAPALAAGNTAVIKPSEFTSTSTLLLMELFERAGFPPGVVNVVTGFGLAVGQPLAAHRLVRKVSFTGGVEGGIKAYGTAAEGLKSVVLELGGKSPNILFPDCDIARASEEVALGIFGSTGQTCVAGSRLLVHRSIHDEVVSRVTEIARNRRMGDPKDPNTELAPVATVPQYDKIMSYIVVAEEEGAHLHTGGKRARGEGLEKGLFIEPTIFTGVTGKMRIAQEEVFGPVLCVIPFDTESEAVALANDISFGLGAGVWTRDIARAHRVARAIQAGTVWINAYRKNAIQVPVGGYKKSGIGRESGSDTIKQYLQLKSVWVSLT
jgi:aldehyde dehydrogenase (NAD+)